MEQIHVVATGGSPILQAGFAAVLARDPSMHLAAAVSNAHEFLDQAARLPCDVLLLDTDVPHDDVAAILPARSGASHVPHVVVLTNNEDIGEIHATLSLGIQGYGIRRFLRPEDVLIAIRTVSQGLSWACPRTIQILMDLVVHLDDGLGNGWQHKLPISGRELEVLHHVASGLREQDIAGKMFLSRNTVKTYLRRIRTKLQVATSAEAVQRCMSLGLLAPTPTRFSGTTGTTIPVPSQLHPALDGSVPYLQLPPLARQTSSSSSLGSVYHQNGQNGGAPRGRG